jgi:hypothetical protein
MIFIFAASLPFRSAPLPATRPEIQPVSPTFSFPYEKFPRNDNTAIKAPLARGQTHTLGSSIEIRSQIDIHRGVSRFLISRGQFSAWFKGLKVNIARGTAR